MKTLNELRAFCEGYRQALLDLIPFCNDSLANADEWVVWGGYDINFTGAEYSPHAETDENLRVNAYKAGWTDNIGEPLHSFTIFGETE